jgi:hypothetical protein
MLMTVLISLAVASRLSACSATVPMLNRMPKTVALKIGGCRGNISEGICGKPSGDGFEGPSLTDFRNRLSKLDPLMGPMASAYQAHIEADHCESALIKKGATIGDAAAWAAA